MSYDVGSPEHQYWPTRATQIPPFWKPIQGIGAVLSQLQSDLTEQVIAYTSRAFSRQEQCHCVTCRELLPW